MIDEIFDVIFGEIAKLIPDVVWGVIFLLAGVVTTTLGVMTLSESARFGGVLTVIGVLLVVGVLVSWYR